MAGPESPQVLPFSALEAHLEDEFQTILNFSATLRSSSLTEAGVRSKAGDYAVPGQEVGSAGATWSITAGDFSTGHEISVDLITAEIWRVEEVECFQAELDAQLLSHTPVLVNREVGVYILWTMTVSTRCIAQGSNLKSRQAKRCRTKDLIVMRPSCATRARDDVWTIVAIQPSTRKTVESASMRDIFSGYRVLCHKIGRRVRISDTICEHRNGIT